MKRQARDSKIVEKIDGIKDIFEEYDMAEAVYEYWDDAIRDRISRKHPSVILSEHPKYA